MQLHNYNNVGNYVVPQECSGGICVDIGGNTGVFSLLYNIYIF
jgi:hypothetical protein